LPERSEKGGGRRRGASERMKEWNSEQEDTDEERKI
jgi:hypothetical protein